LNVAITQAQLRIMFTVTTGIFLLTACTSADPQRIETQATTVPASSSASSPTTIEVRPPSQPASFEIGFDQPSLKLQRGREVTGWNNVLRFKRHSDGATIEPDRFDLLPLHRTDFAVTTARALPGVYWVRVWAKTSSAIGAQKLQVIAVIGSERQQAALEVLVQKDGVDQIICLPDPCVSVADSSVSTPNSAAK
jgi:hypothetical protein